MNSNAKNAETNSNFCVFAMAMNRRHCALHVEGQKPRGSYPLFAVLPQVLKGDQGVVWLLPTAAPPVGSHERESEQPGAVVIITLFKRTGDRIGRALLTVRGVGMAIWMLLVFVVIWFVLQAVVLPKFGINT